MANGKKKKETALVKLENYAIRKYNSEKIKALLAENLGTEQLTPFDLDRVRVPTGGNTSWTVPGIEGDQALEVIEGVMVFHKLNRLYWEEAYSGSNDVPDCLSNDLVVGVGKPGGECAKCPYSQWGSAIKEDGSEGRGQACKQYKMLFVLQPATLLPLVVILPPTSLQAMKQYLLRLSSNATPYYGVVTRLGLKKEKNADGKPYSQVVPSSTAVLDDETRQHFQGISETLRPGLDAVRTRAEDTAEPSE